MKTKAVKAVKAVKLPRFTRGKIPDYIDDAASDFINAMLDEPGLTRYLVLGSPAEEVGQEFDESRTDICLVVVQGPMALTFANAVRKDPKWRK